MKKNLLIIGYVWPEPKSSAAGSRMMQLIDVFQSENYTITFASPCAKSDNAFNLNSIGVTQVSIALNNASFDDFIKDLNPSVVLFDRFMMEEQFGWRVTEHCPNALKILDTEDLHCLRKGRHQAYKDNKPFNKTYLFSDTAKREIASIYRCDITLIISQAEIDILKSDFKVDEALLLYLPFMLEQVSNNNINAFPKFEDRAHFISIGNFLHEPNYNAVLYLKETIWPLIRKELPQAELHIYGAYVSQKVTQLNNKKQGFIVKGFAPDVNTVMQNAKVCLAPIRFGAGLKGKLIDAMQNGTPMVTTTVGAEGMFGDFEPNGFIEDDANCFANKATQLYNNEWFWTEKQTNGFAVINNRFNAVKHKNMFVSRIESTINNLDIHRQHNFTGQMLHHHSMQSTKFMSRWIEEKNKA
ncbi:glycosyltransferase [Algibacter pectinivorans]|uniref:Glycosyl transferases group 1 n=1 Tax=Algibacter pectinivorans TaxID=870482 RepID=A0A1I1R1S6_9FLAO|nr:glycosyltransferase family 4 protein [Algibacter pectinivorans]SFD26068.1 Glycosyl transferases group 1 [Algibacter pectinivorans]